MSNVAYRQIEPGSLVVGGRVAVHGDEAVVLETSRGQARVRYCDSKITEEITITGAEEKGHTPPAQRAAPSVDSSLEELVEGVFQSTKGYVDFAVSSKSTAITDAITELLESHRRKIADDIEELRALRTKFDVVEARLKLLEGRR